MTAPLIFLWDMLASRWSVEARIRRAMRDAERAIDRAVRLRKPEFAGDLCSIGEINLLPGETLQDAFARGERITPLRGRA